MEKIYRVREKTPQTIRQALGSHPELIQDLLYGRGITEGEAAGRFLSPSYERDSHDPFLIPDMGTAVERIIAAARSSELVCVWSDYDCDGVPGGVALSEFLREIGCRVHHYIPHRHEEGYGLNEKGLGEIAKEGIKLIITVDLGTTNIEEIALAVSFGMETIVVDHHIVGPVLPNTLALLNPHRADSTYPCKELCGSGVAWKLIQGVLSRDRFGMSVGKEKWLLDLIGLATLSDMVPLVGENRMLASYGLLVLRRARRPGIRALFKMLRIEPRTLQEDDITFMLTPRINAASRMGHPATAARLLATHDADEGYELARELQALNDERKGVVASITKEARHRLKEQAISVGPIVMGNPRWRPGVLGLVANALMESEGRSVFLWGREGGSNLKGSCRSDGSMNVVEVMRAAGDIFEDFGGHELAGGFSFLEERAHELPKRLADAAEKMSDGGAISREIYLERELDLTDVNHMTLKDVRRIGPFGEGNPKPLFLFPNVEVSQVKTFGKTANHLEISLVRENAKISGISFFSTPESFVKPAVEGSRADIIGHLESDFRGRPRLRVVDIV